MEIKESIIGKVEAVSDKTGGIKINGNWYSSNEATRQYVTKMQKGDYVEATIDDKKRIMFIAKKGKSQNQESKQEETQTEQPKNLDREMEVYESIMQIAKNITDKIFGNDEKYKEFLGQHVNTLFIALERRAREKGLL